MKSFIILVLSSAASLAGALSDTIICNGKTTTVMETPEQNAIAVCQLGTGGNVLVNLLEPGNVIVVSDQIWNEANSILFTSDNDPSTLNLEAAANGFSTFNAKFNIDETGAVQDVSAYFNFGAGTITVQSDNNDFATLEPETALLALAGMTTLGLRQVRQNPRALRSRRPFGRL